jgi:hypothetical protein
LIAVVSVYWILMSLAGMHCSSLPYRLGPYKCGFS